MITGTEETVLAILRGPSGSGKSTTATLLRERYGRGLAIVGQDVVRRTVLKERGRQGAVNVGLIDTMARYLLDSGVHVVIEGIMYTAHYGEMLGRLVLDHAGRSCSWYWNVPFDETARRHLTKPNCDDWTLDDMRGWYVADDTLPGDQIFGPEVSQSEAVERILAATGLLDAVRPP